MPDQPISREAFEKLVRRIYTKGSLADVNYAVATCSLLLAENAALRKKRDDFARKYHEAMDIMAVWGNVDHACLAADNIDLRVQVVALTAKLAAAEGDTREHAADGINEAGELTVAGCDERYRLRDGVMEIEMGAVDGSGRAWVRQLPSRWDAVETWVKEAGMHRMNLNTARAVIKLFEWNAARAVPAEGETDQGAPARTPPATEKR